MLGLLLQPLPQPLQPTYLQSHHSPVLGTGILKSQCISRLAEDLQESSQPSPAHLRVPASHCPAYSHLSAAALLPLLLCRLCFLASCHTPASHFLQTPLGLPHPPVPPLLQPQLKLRQGWFRRGTHSKAERPRQPWPGPPQWP